MELQVGLFSLLFHTPLFSPDNKSFGQTKVPSTRILSAAPHGLTMGRCVCVLRCTADLTKARWTDGQVASRVQKSPPISQAEIPLASSTQGWPASVLQTFSLPCLSLCMQRICSSVSLFRSFLSFVLFSFSLFLWFFSTLSSCVSSFVLFALFYFLESSLLIHLRLRFSIPSTSRSPPPPPNTVTSSPRLKLYPSLLGGHKALLQISPP